MRQYDAVVGRWLSVDPYRQFASPYVGMGNNPISGIDPDGGYTKFGAKVRAFFTAGVSVSDVYQSGGEWGFNTQSGDVTTFNVGTYGEGGSYLSAWEPGLSQRWGMSDNIIASWSYNTIDGPWVTAQFFTPWRKPTHIDGQLVVGEEGAEAFAGAASTALPYTRLSKIPKVTASQFSSYFKGTFVARLQPKVRGWIIKTYNKQMLEKTHGTVLKITKGFQSLVDKGQEWIGSDESNEKR
ncbi:hypothetical protein [Tunicatimonas pelagia]|uniref:hypothetical protein n=1 Tax=Tunicatimonas pelagia TaxID=931531 RepID=UPI002665847D|nr:hypothetical protein [Tunicatimonas pelagia]WKN45306.1 hypothetical protein P0M28_10080 [Tunicatimonas pelagia]